MHRIISCSDQVHVGMILRSCSNHRASASSCCMGISNFYWVSIVQKDAYQYMYIYKQNDIRKYVLKGPIDVESPATCSFASTTSQASQSSGAEASWNPSLPTNGLYVCLTCMSQIDRHCSGPYMQQGLGDVGHGLQCRCLLYLAPRTGDSFGC